jgi:uncharacterized protein with beta-barrel porin domain
MSGQNQKQSTMPIKTPTNKYQALSSVLDNVHPPIAHVNQEKTATSALIHISGEHTPWASAIIPARSFAMLYNLFNRLHHLLISHCLSPPHPT